MAADAEPIRFAGHAFADQDLLAQAMTHRSAGVPHNERLEFLGDAVVGLIVAEALYKRWPKANEGALTRARSEEHTSELQSLMRISYAVFRLKKQIDVTSPDKPDYQTRTNRHTLNCN